MYDETNNECEHDMTPEKSTCYLAMNLDALALPLQIDFFIEIDALDPYAPFVNLLTRLFPAPRYDIDRLTDEIHVYDTTRHTDPDDDDHDPDDADASLLIVSYQF